MPINVRDITRINQARAERRLLAMIMDENQGFIRLIEDNDFDCDPLAPGLRELADKRASGWLEIDGARFFCRLFVPAVRLVVIGAVHTAQALAELNRTLGLKLEVIDPRAAFARESRFVGVDLFQDWPDRVLAKPQHQLDAYSALVTLSHDPKIDDPGLMAALRSDSFYIGALGSRKTHAARIDRLTRLGFSNEAMSRIEAPVGLDIGAKGPEEIALSVLASVIKHYRQL